MGKFKARELINKQLLSRKRNNELKFLGHIFTSLSLGIISLNTIFPASARTSEELISCDMLIVGAGLSGSAAAYEGLLAGKTVCLTELTDWVGGQISSQGNSAFDEGKQQRSLQHFSRGYNVLRNNIARFYNRQNPGECWVSESCFLPSHGHQLLYKQLKKAEQSGNGTLKWFPSTVVKEIELSENNRLIQSAIAIQHSPTDSDLYLHKEPLSHTIKDIYSYSDSERFKKRIIRFQAKSQGKSSTNWFVIETTETGEIIALADIPYNI